MSELLTIPARVIKGMIALSPKRNARDYLNGVFVDVRENETRLVTTDGRWMGIYRIKRVFSGSPATGIIRKSMTKDLRDDGFYVLATELDGDKELLKLMTSDNHPSIKLPKIPYFPSYENGLPMAISGKAAFFNTRFLKRFLRAQRILDQTEDKDFFHLYQNGDQGALIKFRDQNFTGIVMPYANKRELQEEDLWWLKKETKVIPLLNRGKQ